MPFGCHVSTSGGLEKSLQRAVNIGAQTIQIFASSPRTWQKPSHSKLIISNFLKEKQKTKISPVVIHAKYLINLASPNPETLEKSKLSLVDELIFANQIKALGSIVHIGSHKGKGKNKGMKQIIKACQDILAKTPKNTWLILENTAGNNQQNVHKVGSRFEEIGQLIKSIGSDRVKVCLDTQHSFASGYYFSTPVKLEKTLKEFDQKIGLKNLVVVHVNDSHFPFGSGKDQHANLGQGLIGEKSLGLFLQNKKLSDLPFILETPALNEEKTAKNEVAKLKKLAGLTKKQTAHNF